MNAELREAIAAAESLLNFVRPLKKLEEVLKAARGVEQLVTEKQELVSRLDRDVATLQGKIAALAAEYVEKAKKSEEEHSFRVGELAAQLTRDEEERVAKVLNADASYRAAEASRAAVLSALDEQVGKQKAEVEALTVRVNELRAIQAELQSKLRAAA